MTGAPTSFDDDGGVTTATSMRAPETPTTNRRLRNGARRWQCMTTPKAASAARRSGSWTDAWVTAPRGTLAAVATTSTTSAARPVRLVVRTLPSVPGTLVRVPSIGGSNVPAEPEEMTTAPAGGGAPEPTRTSGGDAFPRSQPPDQ